MRRHDIHIANDVNTVLGMIFAAGPVPALMICGLITLVALSLQVIAEPGRAFAGACVLILPLMAWRVGSDRSYKGTLIKSRLVVAGSLVAGAILAYQVQWGYAGAWIDKAMEEGCRGDGYQGYGPSPQAVSRFLSCRRYMTKEQFNQACTYMNYWPETRTLRVRLVCP